MNERDRLAGKLYDDVLAYLREHPGEWVPNTALLTLAPEGRLTGFTEEDTPFGTDDARGPAYDAGPSGRPDGGMLADVTSQLERELLTEKTFPLAWRLYDPDGPVGLQEIAERLRVKRPTADQWRTRGLLPEPTWSSVGGRPAWRWSVIRQWALETGRAPAARGRVQLQALPWPAHPEQMHEPVPHAALWAEVSHLPSFRDPEVKAWAGEQLAAGCGALIATLSGPRVYGQYISAVTVTAEMEVIVSAPELAAVSAASVRGWRR